MGLHCTQVQGLTLSDVVVSFDLNRQKHFNCGQIYVDLSRATGLQGLHVVGQVKNKHVRANPKVHAEYQRMRQCVTCSDCPNIADANHQNLTVCLLNKRSVRKHCIDTKHDVSLTECDILALTETQLLTHDSSNGIREILQPYTLHRQDYPSDKYSSLAICNKGNIHILENQYFSALNGLMFDVLNSITNRGITMLLIYRKNNSNIMQYINHLSNILQIHTIDIILGDLNINYFKELPTLPLKELMNYYGIFK